MLYQFRRLGLIFTTAAVAIAVSASCSDDAATTLPEMGAADIAIDFERLPGPDGRLGTVDDAPMPGCPSNVGCIVMVLSTEFESPGIAFVNWPVTFEPRATSAGNVLTNNHTVNYLSGIEPRPEVRLSIPVYGITVTSLSVWSLRLAAFDTDGALIGSTSMPHPNPGCQGDGASCPQIHGTIVLESRVPIARFYIETEEPSPVLRTNGGQSFKGVALDNLIFSRVPR